MQLIDAIQTIISVTYKVGIVIEFYLGFINLRIKNLKSSGNVL